MHPILNIAIRAARRAGNIIVRYVDRVDSVRVTAKGRNDLVSDVDKEAERVIIETVRAAYPNHGILAEESGSHPGDEHVWVIDPLDGTMNFLHGFPQFSVSIAVKHRGQLDQAVVYDPLRQELFTASRGAGAQLNDRRIRVSKCNSLKNALVGTGYSARSLTELDLYMGTFKELTVKSAGIRRAGSAALDLTYVACGRLDGFWQFGLSEWDVAAGALLIQEAGGIVSAPLGSEDYLSSGNIICGTPKVYQATLDAIQPYYDKHAKTTSKS